MEASIDSVCASTLQVEECYGNGTKFEPSTHDLTPVGEDSSGQPQEAATPLNVEKMEIMK